MEVAPSDVELIRRARTGDESAWTRLYDRYLPAIWRYVYAKVDRDVQDAEDIVSETMLGIVKGMRNLDPERGDISPWVFAIAIRKIVDHLRRANRSNREVAGDVAAIEDPRSINCSVDDTCGVAELLLQLADVERVTLEWKYVEDLTVSEIAARLGRTERAVEAILYRARRSFRALVTRRMNARNI